LAKRSTFVGGVGQKTEIGAGGGLLSKESFFPLYKIRRRGTAPDDQRAARDNGGPARTREDGWGKGP